MSAASQTGTEALAEWGVRQLLALDPETHEAMREIYGKRIHIRLRGFPRQILIAPSEAGVAVGFSAEPAEGIAADVHLGCGMAEFSSLLFGGWPSNGGRDVEIRGDLQALQVLQKALSGYRPDWQDPVSRFIGDPLTQGLEAGLGAFRRQCRSSGKQFLQDLGEYLCHEKRVIADGGSLRAFCADVDRLRGDVDRLAARIRLLEEG